MDARKVRREERLRNKRNYVSIENQIDIITDANSLPSNLMKQISKNFQFSNSWYYIDQINPDAKMPFLSRRIIAEPDIVIHDTFLNNFILVFANADSNKIMGYIKQHETIRPNSDHIHFIPNYQITSSFGSGPFDIYGFLNGSLVFSAKYAAREVPNPFSPQTTLSYSLKDSCFVQIKIYNVEGKLVDSIVNQTMPPGSYDQPWDATDLESGIYFYKVTACDTSVIRKTVLLK